MTTAFNSVPVLLVFAEGLLSFFSPCVIPLLPVYLSYLAGGAKQTREDGTIEYRRGPVFLHTLFFILGISFAFFLLGLSFTALGSFFHQWQSWFSRIGGILIVLLGLFQLGLFELPFLNQEKKFHLNLQGKQMNPLVAFGMGFTFSFAWTPCVGPALSSVLILASGAQNALTGNLLVLVYALGFVIPFLVLGLFTTQALTFLRSHQKLLRYTVKVGGALLVLVGIMVFTGWMNTITAYLNSFAGGSETPAPASSQSQSAAGASSSEGSSSSSQPPLAAFDFTLTDQYGNSHTLADYKGKVVFLNFWTTWCGYCKQEMPDIEALYKEYGENKEDVIILGVGSPANDKNPLAQDVSQEEITAFLTDNGYTFPTVMDTEGTVLSDYRISSFPTTFLIDPQGNIFGYVPGAMSKDMMKSVIEQAMGEG